MIIGDGAVGKTSLLHAFAFGKQFDEDQYNPTFHNTYKDSLSRRLITQQGLLVKEIDHPTNPGEKADLQL